MSPGCYEQIIFCVQWKFQMYKNLYFISQMQACEISEILKQIAKLSMSKVTRSGSEIVYFLINAIVIFKRLNCWQILEQRLPGIQG